MNSNKKSNINENTKNHLNNVIEKNNNKYSFVNNNRKKNYTYDINNKINTKETNIKF